MAAANDSRSTYFLFFPLLFMALVIDIIRLPEIINPYRPDILSLCVIFFATFDPARVNIGWAWIAGLLLDLLTGAPLSQHALCLALQVFLILSQFQRFALFALWQQILIILVVNLLGHVLGYWISHLAGQVNYEESIAASSVVTAALWPVISLLCLFLCRALNLAPPAHKEN
ncbi:MAG: rod shape-determining protein MreD [Candidatus Anaerobiospirillum merdipullorum]|uniref:Rod shape-determining protein MreD n=1 Tax=Candidatus Anaerobiospirillum merdipullorum TaxID=2838450 RepID=A0A9E2KNZ8_9GAMM|nr:rod shape-determining protein MreD [Candidatus Anaerobiospirillum merdipullorum]